MWTLACGYEDQHLNSVLWDKGKNNEFELWWQKVLLFVKCYGIRLNDLRKSLTAKPPSDYL